MMPDKKGAVNRLSVAPNTSMRRRTSVNMQDLMKVNYKGVDRANSILGKFAAPEQQDFKKMISAVIMRTPR
jgi:hypothetical protein